MNDDPIQSYLSPRERLLWSGVPQGKLRFEQKHFPLLFIIPFFLFFLLIPIASIFDGDTSDQSKAGQEQAQSDTANQTASISKPQKPEPLAHRIIFGIGFLLVVGGFFAFMAMCMGVNFEYMFRRDVLYGITDQRVIVVSGKKKKSVHSIHVGSLSDLRMKEWPDGLGKITFGPDPVWPSRTLEQSSNITLENIAEPRKVFQIIAQVHNSR